MPPDRPQAPLVAPLVALRDARESAIARLTDAFAHDAIGLEEFERRLTLVHRAGDAAEIEHALADLSPVSADAAPLARAAPHAALTIPSSSRKIVAIFGGVERCGPWTMPRHLKASAVMGGIVLDLREAVLAAGVSELQVSAVFGGIQIIVPPTLAVEVDGTAILGGVDHVDRMPQVPDPERPLLRVSAFALFGGVQVETRLPGAAGLSPARIRGRLSP